jgi:asparagine synthase (glutamine-hydrolysing)
MCGIGGIILASPGLIKRERVQRLLDHLEHRGPDDSGVLCYRNGQISLQRVIDRDFIGDAVLVHRRLSILDLSAAGRQPMGTRDGRYHIVFNGEIYNYLEIRNELEQRGHTFRSRSDTEVLLAAYANWGEKALTRLIGMFALAVLDIRDRTLFLARDFFGIKPLYYTQCGDGFGFASEIKAMLQLPGVSRRVHPQRFYDYLRFGITDHAEETLFLDIHQVPAGHYLKISLDSSHAARPVRYWSLDLSKKSDLSFDEAAYRVRDLFLESVRLHLRSDVPVGAALSGGVDSSSIVMAMRHLEPTLNIHVFSYVADDLTLSEERWVDIIGQSANATVHKVRPDVNELVSDLDDLVELQEEAFASTSIYAQKRIFQQARKAGIKVMLDGQGADEMLGGYHYFVAARLGSLLRAGRWSDASQLLLKASGTPGLSIAWLGLRTADVLMPSCLQAFLRALVKREFNPRWMNMRWFDQHDVKQGIPSLTNGNAAAGDPKDLLTLSLYDSLMHSSLPHLLRYEDRNSMSFSIESRVPFLTPTLVQFLLALPEEYIVASDGTTKAVFRKAMRGIVPDAILDRRDKIGFETPEKQWLFGERAWVEGVLTSEAAMQVQALDWNVVQREWQSILRGRQRFDSRVWRWLNTVLWAQKFAVVTDEA